MDKELLKKSIEDVEKSLEMSRDNKRKSEQHIAEGELILEVFMKKLKELE